MTVGEALTLFRRLGVNVENMTRGDFRITILPSRSGTTRIAVPTAGS